MAFVANFNGSLAKRGLTSYVKQASDRHKAL